ncbi:hypothetical protein H0H92_011404, partial [Tricholoma furcatifolium]
IKAEVDKEWAKLHADAKKNGTTVTIPRITLTNEFLARRFAEEPEDVREGLEQQTKDEFIKAKAAFKLKSNWKPRSAAEYKEAMDEAATTLVPFADAIAERYGMYACVMLCGPTDNGEISLKSVHSNVEDTQLGKIWPVEDREGYAAAQQSIINYAKKIFTHQECNARKVIPSEPLQGLGAVLSAIDVDEDDVLAGAGVSRDPTIDPAVYENIADYIARNSEPKKRDDKNNEQEKNEAHQGDGNGGGPAPQTPQPSTPAVDTSPSPSAEAALALPVDPAAAVNTVSAPAGASATETTPTPAGAPATETVPTPVLETTPAAVQPVQDLAPSPVTAPTTEESPASSSDPQAQSEELNALIGLVPKGSKMLEGLTRLRDKKWGAEWEQCLCSLIEFEKSRSFP